jgi:uncharacterized protein with von Willebrand factor type A (vWA) domain
MFLDLFYGLRDEGVPVAVQEWRTFLEALEQGLHGSSLLRFYHLGRACLVKSETYFDAYDRVFARVFKGVEGAGRRRQGSSSTGSPRRTCRS